MQIRNFLGERSILRGLLATIGQLQVPVPDFGRKLDPGDRAETPMPPSLPPGAAHRGVRLRGRVMVPRWDYAVGARHAATRASQPSGLPQHCSFLVLRGFREAVVRCAGTARAARSGVGPHLPRIPVVGKPRPERLGMQVHKCLLPNQTRRARRAGLLRVRVVQRAVRRQFLNMALTTQIAGICLSWCEV